MNEKTDNDIIPIKYDAEDKIFNLCDIESPKFMQFITHIDDIVGPFHKRFLSNDYKDLNLDHVSIRTNGELVHAEHQAEITSYVMKRNFQYLTSLHLASKSLIYPFIFNTGSIPKNTIEFASTTSFYNPVIINTQEIEESVRLNNIRYKLNHNQQINIFDIFDLIWMPKYRSDRDPEDIVVELSEIYNKIFVNKNLRELLRKSLILWTGKFISDEKNLNKIIGELKMSAQEAKLLEQDIINARIGGIICRAEDAAKKEGREEGIEKGREEGIEKGREEGISAIVIELLEVMTPEEISEKTSLSLEEVLKIKNRR